MCVWVLYIVGGDELGVYGVVVIEIFVCLELCCMVLEVVDGIVVEVGVVCDMVKGVCC